MGQGLSCGRSSHELEFLSAVEVGDSEAVRSALRFEAAVLHRTTAFDRLSALHIAASNGRDEVISMILDRSVHPDRLNRHKQTPLMLAAMHGKIGCVQRLLQAGANILMFDSLHGRTCLHYAAYYGHSDCLQAILSAATSTPVADSWGFTRFVNIRDKKGATPLHLAARLTRSDCVHILLDNGALVCASTGGYGSASGPGSTPLHLAARGGCLDCVRELLAWGADRLQRDSSGRIPYIVALKRKHVACAALLNPSSAEPLVWPTPLKFISELDPEAKFLLESALMEANKESEKKILKGTEYSMPSPVDSDVDVDVDGNLSQASDTDLCCICFDQICTIEIQDCGHQMCAHCTLALCCHNKPKPTASCSPTPLCPFCRSSIARLAVAKAKVEEEEEEEDNCPSKLRRSRRFRNLSEGSSSFKGLTSAMNSLGRIGGRESGRIVDSGGLVDKM